MKKYLLKMMAFIIEDTEGFLMDILSREKEVNLDLPFNLFLKDLKNNVKNNVSTLTAR